MTAVVDMYPKVFRRGYRRELLILALSVVSYFLGLVMLTEVSDVDTSKQREHGNTKVKCLGSGLGRSDENPSSGIGRVTLARSSISLGLIFSSLWRSLEVLIKP